MPSTARRALAKRYLRALRVHLAGKNKVPGSSARRLGLSALNQGVMTLDLAMIHQHAVAELTSSFDFVVAKGGNLRRAVLFFGQALVPLEKDRQNTRETNRQLLQRNDTLRTHTAELARSNRRLEGEVQRRKTSELAVLSGKERYRKLFLHSELMQKKLRRLTRQIISAQEDERKEISRELHDEVVQTLVGINVELAALSRSANQGQNNLKAKITRTQRLVESSVNAVHRFARELRPAVLDDLGLIPALHAYSKAFAGRKKINIHLTAFDGVEALPSASRMVLFRVAQEAMTNVARHAHAARIQVMLRQIPSGVRMEIHDDGISFEVQKALGARNHSRLGLIGMNERLEMIGGSLTLESAPGRGTTVRAEVPHLFPTNRP